MRASVLLATCLLVSGGIAPAHAAAPARNGSFPWASPDGKHIVFASTRSGTAAIDGGKPAYLFMRIYTMDADGSEVRQLTDSDTADFAPVWSPDGKWIVFGANDVKTEKATLTAMHPDGSARHGLLTDSMLPWVRLSPDSRRIIFTAIDAKGAYSINTLNMDGSDRQVIATGLDKPWDGIWSPDGKHLVFAECPPSAGDPVAQKSDVYIADANGGHRRLLATFAGFIQLPAWSPDGRSIAYQTYTGKKGEADVVVLDVATGRFRTVSRRDGSYLDETPSWTPDGRILFQSTRGGRFDVYVMDADGSNVHLLTR